VKKKRVLYTALKYPYAKPSLGLSYEYYNILDSLRQIKTLEVVEFDWVTLFKKHGRRKMNELLFQKVKTYKPDLVFFSIFREEFNKEVVREISSRTLTYNWFCDDLWRFDTYAKNWAPCFSHISTLNEEVVPKYKSIGYERVVVTQPACNPRMYQKLKVKKMWPVSFVGQTHSNRKRIVTELKRRNIKIATWGQGWRNGVVSFGKMVKIFNQSKININFTDTSFSFRFGRFLPWFFQPINIESSMPTTILNGRVFEVPMCGGFLLTDSARNLEKCFDIGKEIVVYDSLEDLVEKINYYLKNDKKRDKIAKAGHERAQKDHTYKKRFTEIFERIGAL